MAGRIPHAFLFVILLSACAGQLQGIEDAPIPSTLTSSRAQTIFYLDSSALSYGVFETDSTAVSIDVYSTAPQAFGAFADISVDDGSGVTTYKVQPGKSTIVHSMASGKKRVTITSGGQAKLENEMTGVSIQRLTFDRATVQIQPSGRRIVVYGDSITVGGNVENPSAEAWPVLLRKHYAVIVDAYGYRTLYDDASSPAKSSRLAARISAWTPDDVWLAIGTNDYGFGQWSAREFGEAYAGLLDALHSSDPRARVFAQSPIRRGNESANSFGNTLEDYRQQITTACLARATWCIFVDGKGRAFPQPDELDKDGIHLTTSSSRKYAEAVFAAISR
jgi:lysophospholipase L1-like esterase